MLYNYHCIFIINYRKRRVPEDEAGSLKNVRIDG